MTADNRLVQMTGALQGLSVGDAFGDQFFIHANEAHELIRKRALPALGCGLGGLDWADVGPIVCTTASQMDIPICVYLPADTTIPGEQLQANYLIRS